MSETLVQTTARITQFIQENAPTLDLSPGSVFSELILNLESKIQNQVYNDIAALSAGQTIAAALASATDTYNPIIDSIASNFGVVRNQGKAATGVIRISVSRSNNITVPAGTAFIQPNLSFIYQTVESTTATLSDGSLTIGQGQTSPSTALYYFDVNVQANEIGVDKIVPDGTQFQLAPTSVSSVPYFLSANAVGSFLQGQSAETDKQLIARFRAGQSVANYATQDAIYSILQQTFPSFQSIYLADHNDPLNLRATDNPFQLKMPGYVDIYLRNSVALPQVSFNISDASYDSGSGVWTLSIPASSAPGFYRVISVVDSAAPNAPLPFVTVYGVDGSADNTVSTAAEARYSVYQTATLSVTYPTSTTPTFIVTVLAPNLLNQVQTLLLNSATRLPNADYLVKGVVPCEVSIYISVTRSDSNPLNVTALKADIFNYVNGLGVGQPIAVSKLINLCHNYNVAQVSLPLVLNGTLRAPYAAITDPVGDFDIPLTGTDTLTIPNLPQYGVTQANTAFFINYFGGDAQENISISVN